MKKKVIVTGASGHIGYHVALQLIGSGFDVQLLIRKENPNITRLRNKGAQVITADLMQPETYAHVFKGIDVLFHLASENTTDTSDEKKTIDNTFGLSKKVLDTALAADIKTIIYTSSVVVLGRSPDPQKPLNENDKAGFLESPYVKGKFLAEEYCDELIKTKQADIRRIYPSWVVGTGYINETPPHKVIRQFLEKGQLFYFKGGISIAAVEEVAKAHVNALLKGKPQEKYIAAGNNITFKQFYALLASLSGKKKPIVFLPKWFVYLASMAARLVLGKKSPVDPAYIKSVIGNYSWYDSSKTIRELDYTIPPAQEILQQGMLAIKQDSLGLNKLVDKQDAAVAKTEYAAGDLLLITGIPGWLGNRMIDVFMNGDTFGKYAINRKIRLLVQPQFKGLFPAELPFEIVYGDITDKNSLREALKDVKAVYHLAGVIYPKKISSYYKVNYEGTKNLVDVCIEEGVKRLLFMSTDSTCGYSAKGKIFDEHTPPTPYKNYGRSKYMAEKYLIDKTAEGLIEGTSLRGFWFFGPFMPARNLGFFKMFYWKRQVIFGNGKNLRSISHVDNIIQAFIKAEKKSETIGKWYWIGNKKPVLTVNGIYETLAAGLNVPYKPLHVPNIMCELFSIFDSFISIFGKLNATIHAAGKFHKNIAGEITAAERDFNYDPQVGFEEIKKELKELKLR